MGKIQTDSNPEDELLKHCKNSIIKNFNLYTVKKILKPMFSLHLGNEKRYRKNICGFEIPEK